MTLAKNLRAAMDAHPDLDTVEKLVKRGAGSNGTIGRMLVGNTACRIDALQQVARVFGLEAWQLLVPGFDPDHPPTLEMDSRRASLLASELDDIAELAGKDQCARFVGRAVIIGFGGDDDRSRLRGAAASGRLRAFRSSRRFAGCQRGGGSRGE